jgi:hypothetical protein
MPEKSTVQLNLSETQLRLLVEAMYLFEWIVCSGDKFRDRKYQTAVKKLEQVIFREALQRGHTDLVDFEKGDREIFPTRHLEEESKAREALNAHDEENFWEELISQLSSVFAAREARARRWDKLGPQERFRQTCVHADRIRAALVKHGLHGISLLSAEPAE